MLEDLDHVVIHIDDWEASHHFYLEVLGMARVESRGRRQPARCLLVSHWLTADQRPRTLAGQRRTVLPTSAERDRSR